MGTTNHHLWSVTICLLVEKLRQWVVCVCGRQQRRPYITAGWSKLEFSLATSSWKVLLKPLNFSEPHFPLLEKSRRKSLFGLLWGLEMTHVMCSVHNVAHSTWPIAMPWGYFTILGRGCTMTCPSPLSTKVRKKGAEKTGNHCLMRAYYVSGTTLCFSCPISLNPYKD